MGLTLPVYNGRTRGYFHFTQEVHVVKGLFCFLQYTNVFVTMTITDQSIATVNDTVYSTCIELACIKLLLIFNY